MPIKTFRGLLYADQVDTISLHTNDGSTGYRIVKFDIISHRPGAHEYEATVTVSKIPFTPASDIDLNDNTILAVAYWHGYYSTNEPQTGEKVVFDNEIFNQDIFVGLKDRQNNEMNYYIELEEIKLDLGNNTVATLKDIRNIEQR